MGISRHEAAAFIRLYKTAGPFGRVATLGRQTLFVDPAYLRTLYKEINKAPSASQASTHTIYPWADDFLRLLGASEVISFDSSDYEGASVSHDMNLPIPSHFRESFDLVYDGGTLEHVFNFPQAIKNCMDLLKVSGLFVCATPSNNFMGHGFYQFSPELFFRLFSGESGFNIEQMLAFEYETGGRWFEVKDPSTLGRRAELRGTGSRVVLWVVARKAATTLERQLPCPQQSDYVSKWNSKGHNLLPEISKFTELSQSLRKYFAKSFPEASDCFRGFRDRWHLRRANRKGLGSDSQGFRRLT